MCQVFSINNALHDNNVRRIARRILNTLDTTALATDIADKISHPLPGLNNWFIIKFIINRHFPRPSLCHVREPAHVEMEVIRQLMVSMRQSPLRNTHSR